MSECKQCAVWASLTQDWKDTVDDYKRRERSSLKHTMIQWFVFLTLGMAIGDGWGPPVREWVAQWNAPPPRWYSPPLVYSGSASVSMVYGGPALPISSLAITSWQGPGQVATIVSGRMMLDIGPVGSSDTIAQDGSQ